MSRVAIMQPYFVPYIGYFQLMAAVDLFIVYDNIKYTKKGWINRNRILREGTDGQLVLPLKKDSDSRHICERQLAASFNPKKLLEKIKGAYRRAPQFAATYPMIEDIVRYEEGNLFGYVLNSIAQICKHIGITTEIRISSEIPIDHSLRHQEKVLALCQAVGASTYINAIGGTTMYSRDVFQSRGIQLQFIRAKPFEYAQFGCTFVPWLSIIDVLMFNPIDAVRQCVRSEYELL